MADRAPVNRTGHASVTRCEARDGTDAKGGTGKIMDEVSPVISRVLRRHRVAPGTDPEDVRQDVFVSLLEQIQKGNRISDFVGYAVRVTVNACRQTFRSNTKERYFTSLSEDDDRHSAAAADQELVLATREELRHVWRQAVVNLSPEQLRVFVFGWRGLLDDLSEMPDIESVENIARAVKMDETEVLSLRDEAPSLINEGIADRLGMTANRFYRVRREVWEWLGTMKY